MTLNPVPRCEACGRTTVRVQTTAGKGRYKCTNGGCPNYMKKAYIRGSRKRAEG